MSLNTVDYARLPLSRFKQLNISVDNHCLFLLYKHIVRYISRSVPVFDCIALKMKIPIKLAKKLRKVTDQTGSGKRTRLVSKCLEWQKQAGNVMQLFP
jgi:hypothetical protein